MCTPELALVLCSAADVASVLGPESSKVNVKHRKITIASQNCFSIVDL